MVAAELVVGKSVCCASDTSFAASVQAEGGAVGAETLYVKSEDGWLVCRGGSKVRLGITTRNKEARTELGVLACALNDGPAATAGNGTVS